MRRATRDEALLRMLGRTGSASVADLADSLGVCEATVRRSLQRLSLERRVVRTYGGAFLVGHISMQQERPDPQGPYKRAIAAAAASLVSEGDTVALSSGSTVVELARQLRQRRLTVITNAIDVVNVLLDAPHVEVVVLGGVMLSSLHSLGGHLTELTMRELRADTVFMGASAIDSDRGFMTDHVPEIAVDRGLSQMGREVVILADASKFDCSAPGFMLGLDQVGVLVTDHRVPHEVRSSLAAKGIRMVISGEAAQPGDAPTVASSHR